MMQPAAMLDLEVYHRNTTSLQRIRTAQWHVLYRHLYSDILKNGMAILMVEMLQKTVTEPEQNPELFSFCEACLHWLDRSNDQKLIALFPLYFSLHLTHFFGFRIPQPSSEVQEKKPLYLNLQEGLFTNQVPQHAFYLEGNMAYQLAELLKVLHPDELGEIACSAAERSGMLDALLLYYRQHVPNFGEIRSLQIIRTILR